MLGQGNDSGQEAGLLGKQEQMPTRQDEKKAQVIQVPSRQPVNTDTKRFEKQPQAQNVPGNNAVQVTPVTDVPISGRALISQVRIRVCLGAHLQMCRLSICIFPIYRLMTASFGLHVIKERKIITYLPKRYTLII